MAVPLIIAAPTIGVSVGLSKRAANRRKQAAANAFSQKYPLLDDAGAMQGAIDAAVLELKNIDATPAKTAGAKRIKKRNSDALRQWIVVMNEHNKDLKSGINIASTQVAAAVEPAVPTATTMVIPQETQPIQAVLPQVQAGSATQEPKELSDVNTETDVKNTGNLAASTKQKGVNWLLIAGVGVAIFLGYKYFKK